MAAKMGLFYPKIHGAPEKIEGKLRNGLPMSDLMYIGGVSQPVKKRAGEEDDRKKPAGTTCCKNGGDRIILA